MRYVRTDIDGVISIEIEPHRDVRGYFARTFCPDELAAAGITFSPVQMNVSRNDAALTLRGMHWQDAPYDEAKLVRVTRGAIFDVVVDLRPSSKTFRRWIGRQLDAEAANALFIPEGCAHGFLTLQPETDVSYLMGKRFVPGHARGFRYDDPAIGIAWPMQPRVIATADVTWPLLS